MVAQPQVQLTPYAIASPVITALTAGMAISVKINVDSTGASTLNWNGKGAKGIKKANGTNVTNLKSQWHLYIEVRWHKFYITG